MRKIFAGTLMLAAFAATLSAQMDARRPLPGPPMPCPRPIHLVIKGESNPPAPDPATFGSTLYPLVSGSQWNQTATDKAFGTTFHFPAPAPGKECCLMTKGTLVVTLKALQGGGVNSSTAWNDDIVVFDGTDKFWDKRVWPQGSAVATGATVTLTIPISSTALSAGYFNLYVEDDTAVVSAVLTLDGCCLK